MYVLYIHLLFLCGHIKSAARAVFIIQHTYCIEQCCALFYVIASKVLLTVISCVASSQLVRSPQNTVEAVG